MNDRDTGLGDFIASRRTIHNFKSTPVPDKEIIKDAIASACWAPNHHLTEPWHFFLLGKETITQVCELNKKLLSESKGPEKATAKYERWITIPGWIVVTCQKSDDPVLYMEDYAACSCAVQNLMLCLWEKEIGTKWSTGPVTKDNQFYDLVWVNPDMEEVIGLIWYGYPADIPKTTRKPALQIMTELP